MENIPEKYVRHWAERLEVGDRVTGTIRHKSDGSKNRHNVIMIVIENNKPIKSIKAAVENEELVIPYNELNALDHKEEQSNDIDY